MSQDRWYLIASGDYAIRQNLIPSLYCPWGDGRTHERRILCSAQAGNPEVEIRFDQELGGGTRGHEITKTFEDIDGYDRHLVTVLSGVMPKVRPDGVHELELTLPIASPPR